MDKTLQEIRRALAQGLPVTLAQKQWIINQCVRYRVPVSLQARLEAHRQGFATQGLVVKNG